MLLLPGQCMCYNGSVSFSVTIKAVLVSVSGTGAVLLSNVSARFCVTFDVLLVSVLQLQRYLVLAYHCKQC